MKLSTNLLALSLHLSQASCSPSSRRVSPAGSIQLPAPRDPDRPCCAGCTCDCRCGKTPTYVHGSPRLRSQTSDTQRGRREGSRGGSRPREPSTKRAPSRPSQDSGRRDATPTKDQRPGATRTDETRAASTRDQRFPGAAQAQAQAHNNLPMRGRPTIIDPQASSSQAQAQSGRSKLRDRDAAAAGHHDQPSATSTTLPRPPPLPQATGASVPVPGQQQQHQGQRPPHGQAVPATQQHRDPRYGPISSGTQHHGAATSTQTQTHMPRSQVPKQTAGALQKTPHDPFHGPGPSYQTQAGPSSLSTPSGAPVPADVRVASQPQRIPDDTPVKKKYLKNTPLKSFNPFKKKEEKEEKK